MFLINSRQESFAAARIAAGRAYPEVTPAILPSSFTRNHSFALVYSTYPPVSVSSTDSMLLILENFLGSPLPSVALTEIKASSIS